MLLASAHPAQRRLDFTARSAAVPAAGWVRRQEAIMGTAISVELWSDDRRQGEAGKPAAGV